jgi:hypothetical protein
VPGGIAGDALCQLKGVLPQAPSDVFQNGMPELVPCTAARVAGLTLPPGGPAGELCGLRLEQHPVIDGAYMQPRLSAVAQDHRVQVGMLFATASGAAACGYMSPGTGYQAIGSISQLTQCQAHAHALASDHSRGAWAAAIRRAQGVAAARTVEERGM